MADACDPKLSQVFARQVRKDTGVDGIVAECGGSCLCATCHVYVEEKFLPLLAPIDEAQDAMLDSTACERLPNSRLSCQIQVRPELEGLVVRMPEYQK